jgi:hypothetical protein
MGTMTTFIAPIQTELVGAFGGRFFGFNGLSNYICERVEKTYRKPWSIWDVDHLFWGFRFLRPFAFQGRPSRASAPQHGSNSLVKSGRLGVLRLVPDRSQSETKETSCD